MGGFEHTPLVLKDRIGYCCTLKWIPNFRSRENNLCDLSVYEKDAENRLPIFFSGVFGLTYRFSSRANHYRWFILMTVFITIQMLRVISFWKQSGPRSSTRRSRRVSHEDQREFRFENAHLADYVRIQSLDFRSKTFDIECAAILVDLSSTSLVTVRTCGCLS
ncbi:hypothetical protein METSCH_C07490 [Metschnikowia aff. pulcherrima]|uniref:Uncharacterized protein n=1 Tax=Metschnikowia aff. pulcherrima TaxID=2163413 RepID=A0A4P6XRP1_9ASCO|nr:hypothetical protein METSCH_C07490 [Metschnikowia aff. pulcherrima]